MTNAERMRRIARAQGLGGEGGRVLLANLSVAVDPAWVRHVVARPGVALIADGVLALAHVGEEQVDGVAAAMLGRMAAPSGLEVIDAADPSGLYDRALRKRETPFAMRLTTGTVPAIERASYRGAYKGVTDLLTKYLWPEWAFHLTRLAAAIGLSPNGVTAIGSALCVLATVAFWHGWFWAGMATGLTFMVLDTVDGKLARCTITSSALGNAWDHGVDLIHPPFWWWAWGVGCAAYGRPLEGRTFGWIMGVMLAGYVAQRLIEGGFLRNFGFHIHVWRRFDSWFRLITARRNPNMVILFASMLVARPDWGIIAVAVWTLLSLVVHFVRLVQAMAVHRRGEPIVSWLA